MINHPNRNKTTTASVGTGKSMNMHNHDRDYEAFRKSVVMAFAKTLNSNPAVLFEVATEDLFEIYLDNVPGERQQHNCNACRQFFNRYGALATISPDGKLQSAMWCNEETTPTYYQRARELLAYEVERGRVRNVFVSSDPLLGTPNAGGFEHFAVILPPELTYPVRGVVLTPSQKQAVHHENYKMVRSAIDLYDRFTISKAIALCRNESVQRSEKFLAPLEWLLSLYPIAFTGSSASRKLHRRRWLAVATAPEGYCHISSSAVGSMLDDIQVGLSEADVIKRFNAKLNPITYQRPQAAPAAGNVVAAEKIVAALGIEKSLQRRFAMHDELTFMWENPIKAQHDNPIGLFAKVALKHKHKIPLTGSPTATHWATSCNNTMTWAKFASKIMPHAVRIQMLVPGTGSYAAFTSAYDSFALPILKWDSTSYGNPIAWYLYVGGARASMFNLTANMWVDVEGICDLPNNWGPKPMPELFTGNVLVLENARDVMKKDGNCLFPEILKNDLREIRSTIEAYSKIQPMHPAPNGEPVAGYLVDRNTRNISLRAYVDGSWQGYKIDRWD